MSERPTPIYKVRVPVQHDGNLFACLGLMIDGMNWLCDNGRDAHFINVYTGPQTVTFVLDDLDTALLMRLSIDGDEPDT